MRNASMPTIVLVALFTGLPIRAQQAPSQPSAPMVPVRTYSVNGMISDVASHARLDYVRVELRSPAGGVVQTSFSNTNGTFHFENVGAGSYILAVDQVGYESVSERVEVIEGSIYGVQIDLAKTADPNAPVNPGPSVVSARELSIPIKAHDDMQRGMALLYGKSDYRGSLKSFEKAIQEYPEYYEAYTEIGIAYVKLADAANAEKAFRKSIEVSRENYADAYVGLAELFLNNQRSNEAEPLARKAVEIDSKSWQADSELARALIDLHRPAEAEASAAAAVRLKPDEATLYLLLANTHIQLRKSRALLDDLDHYLKLAPNGSFAEQARRERDQIQQALAASPGAPATPPPPQP